MDAGWGSAPSLRRLGSGLVAAAVTGWLLSGCGPAPSASAPGSVQEACQQVSAVLSDGPDPSVDPLGYAEAQILPLGQIRTGDASLQTAIDKLASAYRQEYATGGAAQAERAVAGAAAQLNAICPGAAP
jgi:hypothetical protein